VNDSSFDKPYREPNFIVFLAPLTALPRLLSWNKGGLLLRENKGCREGKGKKGREENGGDEREGKGRGGERREWTVEGNLVCIFKF